MIKNKSPLRYPGGKTRACKILDELFLENFDKNKIKTIISPFFGGGSFEFFLQNKYNFHIKGNDKFTPLYNFWNVCKSERKKELVKKLFDVVSKITKEDFLHYRSNIIEENDLLQSAFEYFIINRCSFSGATLSGGFSKEASKKRFTKSSIDRIQNLDLSKFEISNLDFEDFIKNNGNENELLFLDPPYYLGVGSKLYGKNGDLHENFDHLKLYECLKNQKKWIMTYNNCDYIRNLYKDYTIIETSWKYGMNKSKKSSEIVILSKKNKLGGNLFILSNE